MRAFGKTQKVEDGTTSASKPNILKVESKEDYCDSECYNKSDGKPVHVDIDKEVIERGPALALLPNKLEEEELNIKGKTMGGHGIICVRRSNRTLKSPDRLPSVP